MTSERQKAANRANALRSTGPKTPQGKAAVRFSAFKHGLLARDVVLPGEDTEVFEDLWNQVRAKFPPVGPIEEFLVDRIADTMWRLRRWTRAETALLHSRAQGLKARRLSSQVRSYELHFGEASLPPTITDEAAHSAAKEELKRAEYEMGRDEVLLAGAIAAGSDTISTMSRYQKSLERSLFRYLDELGRLQEPRRNRSMPPISDAITPAAGDAE